MENETIPSVFDEIATKHQYDYATTGQRFANYLIDLTVAYTYNVTVTFIIGFCLVFAGVNLENIKEFFSNKAFIYLFTLINMTTAYTLIEGLTKGRSLGKMITRTKAVKEDFKPFTFKDALIRSLCRFIPFEPFSAFGGFPWHDRCSNTMVIKKPQMLL